MDKSDSDPEQNLNRLRFKNINLHRLPHLRLNVANRLLKIRFLHYQKIKNTSYLFVFSQFWYFLAIRIWWRDWAHSIQNNKLEACQVFLFYFYFNDAISRGALQHLGGLRVSGMAFLIKVTYQRFSVPGKSI
jgi:hypothetical protein